MSGKNIEKMLEHQFGAKVTMSTLGPKLRALASHKRRGQISIALWGPPGVGKTSLTRQIAAALGIGYRRYDLPTTDYIQLGGIPELRPDAKGNKHAVRYPILDIPADGEGIFVLDDFTHAPTTVQNLALDLALEHRLNDAVLGPGWMLILCANDTGGVFPMPSPVANRLFHFFVSSDYEAFREWWLRNNLRDEVMGYIDTRKEFLYQEPQKQEKAFPTPRSWAAFSTALDMVAGVETTYEEEEVEEELLVDGTTRRTGKVIKTKRTMIERPDLTKEVSIDMVSTLAAAAVGAPAAADFIAYLNTYGMIDFPSVLDGTHPKLAEVAKRLGGDEDKHPAAGRQALEFALVARARSWWNTKARSTKVGRAKALGNILGYLSASFQSLTIRDFAFTDGSRLSQVMAEVKRNPELKFVEQLFAQLGKVMAGKTLE